MNSDNEFQNPGKKMPYQVPDGFFSKITGETLQRARLRDKTERRRMIIQRTLAAAASFVILIVLGFLVYSPVPEKETAPVARNIQNVSPKPEVFQDDPPVLNPDTAEMDSPVQISGEREDTIPEFEKMEELLASMSDEEIVEWAYTLKTDFFINESENDLP